MRGNKGGGVERVSTRMSEGVYFKLCRTTTRRCLNAVFDSMPTLGPTAAAHWLQLRCDSKYHVRLPHARMIAWSTHLCLCACHDLTEGPPVPECVEDVAECAAEDALDGLRLVSSLQQVLQRADDGQAGTNSALRVFPGWGVGVEVSPGVSVVSLGMETRHTCSQTHAGGRITVFWGEVPVATIAMWSGTQQPVPE
jgi:hypothetical protein